VGQEDPKTDRTVKFVLGSFGLNCVFLTEDRCLGATSLIIIGGLTISQSFGGGGAPGPVVYTVAATVLF
jgi:hypothetical protein